MEQKQVLRVSDGGKLTCAHPVQARMMSSHAWIHYSISTYGQHAEAEGCEVRETNVPPTLPDETTTITRATFDTSSTPYTREQNRGRRWTETQRQPQTTYARICPRIPPRASSAETHPPGRSWRPPRPPPATRIDRLCSLRSQKKKLKLHVIYHNIINLYLLYYDILDIVIGLFFL